ncbi:transcription initiation protein spt4 [Dendrothele bispora CBS 962.96]|uniref:Transcription elongation factor SPT4 n=1 Tax=Dendrothele bispora (strain CBS 962.96) TaxID=1314807 RepID=A0A4S8MDA5_DENBC|nr:transcription initiation protein spt4 [Dendrothele bispora CBS 962.96]
MTAVIPPSKSRQLRACLLCGLIQSSNDFRFNGCPNCEDILQLKDSADRVMTCTSTYFEGMIAGIDPENSWVLRWQRTSKYVRGMYAVRVRGRVPEDVEAELESRGIKYRPRDLSLDQD